METILQLAIIESSPNEAENYISSLRNAGIAARLSYIADADTLETTLNKKTIDMIFCASHVEALSPEQSYHMAKKHNPDIPFLVLGDQQDLEFVNKMLQLGAKDVIAEDSDEHLALVTKREIQALEYQRGYHQIEKKYKESEDRCNQLMESSRDAIAYIHDGAHMHANIVYLNMFGYEEPDDLLGIPILDMIDANDHIKFKQFLKSYHHMDDNQENQLEVKGKLPNDKSFDAIMEFSPATLDGEACTQIIIRDRANSKELQEKLENLSNLDLLTESYNRQYFMKKIEDLIHDKPKNMSRTALCYIQLDNYKKIRDKMGIATSDEVIKEVAAVIKTLTTEQDTFARFADHVFTLLSTRYDQSNITEFAQKICQEVDKHNFEQAGQFVTTQCSVGIVFAGEYIETAQEFIGHAMSACETANLEGGNRYQLHNPIQTSNTENDEQLSTQAIKFALETNKFTLVYQPIISLHGDETENYTVLLRMLDDKNQYIMPDKFIPNAKKNKLIFNLDKWVIQHALEILAKNRAEGKPLVFFIKISALSLTDQKLLLWIVDCMKKYKVHGSWLVFQIDEVEVRSHLKQSKQFLAGLEKIKATLAMDRFGLEANIEDFIKHIPAKYIKIDASIIETATQEASKQELIRNINEMAHGLDMKTIAKSVEDANTLALLWGSGVDYIQGHFLQEPTEKLDYNFAGEDDED